jgi:hypothetical protein
MSAMTQADTNSHPLFRQSCQNRCTEQVPLLRICRSARSGAMPNPIYSSHPNSRLVKRRRVPTAAEQCGCTILREQARQVANGSHSVAPSVRNSILRSSNMKRSPQRAERRRGWRVGHGPRRRSQFVISRNLESGAKLFCGCRPSNHQYRLCPLVR